MSAVLSTITPDERINADPLAKTIVSIMNAMRADYGRIFTKQFGGEDGKEIITLFKRRLYQKLKGIDIEAIVEGYEICIGRNTKFCPTVPEIVGAALETVKAHKKRDQNLEEAARVSALPAPKIIECDPLAMLAKVKRNATNPEEASEDRMKRRADILQNHEALLVLNSHKIKRRYAGQEHSCEYGGCNSAGGIANSTTGNGNYYCATHYRMA